MKPAPLRYVSYSIDSVLLTAALMLIAVLPAAVFANHWLTVRLEGTRSNRQGIGATVLVTIGGRTQARAVLS